MQYGRWIVRTEGNKHFGNFECDVCDKLNNVIETREQFDRMTDVTSSVNSSFSNRRAGH